MTHTILIIITSRWEIKFSNQKKNKQSSEILGVNRIPPLYILSRFDPRKFKTKKMEFRYRSCDYNLVSFRHSHSHHVQHRKIPTKKKLNAYQWRQKKANFLIESNHIELILLELCETKQNQKKCEKCFKFFSTLSQFQKTHTHSLSRSLISSLNYLINNRCCWIWEDLVFFPKENSTS